MDLQDRTYLTIVGWSPERSEGDRAAAIADVLGLAPAVAKPLAIAPLPAIIRRLDAGQAREAIARLSSAGATAISISHPEIEAISLPRRAKCVAIRRDEPGATLAFEYWHAGPREVRAQDVVLIVRAAVRQTHTTTTADAQVASGIHGAEVVWQPVSQKHVKIVETLDLYERAGMSVRIAGDHFRFDAPGSTKRLTEREHVDDLCELLARECPGAIVDRGFTQWRPGAGLAQASPSGASVGAGLTWDGTRLEHGTTRAFEFYSPWRAVVARRSSGNSA